MVVPGFPAATVNPFLFEKVVQLLNFAGIAVDLEREAVSVGCERHGVGLLGLLSSAGAFTG